MRLQDVDMIQLLPAWMRQDGSVKGLAAGCDLVTRKLLAHLKLLSRWDQLDKLTQKELDELAWELNIKWYDSAASISVKRALIRGSDRVYAKLGTKFAVEQIISDYFGSGRVSEWYEYGGNPHYFRIYSDNLELIDANIVLFLKLLGSVKRRSSWLEAIVIALTPGRSSAYFGMIAQDVSREKYAFVGKDGIHLYPFAALHERTTETIRIGVTTLYLILIPSTTISPTYNFPVPG